MDMVHLSIRAKQLLEEGVIENIFDLLREDLKGELLRTSPEEKDKRENLYFMLKALEKLEMKFTWVCTKSDFDEFNKQQNDSNRRV
ncbi:hypothetical protein SXHG_00078 [Synechococcus phage MRHenn-2013a]|nr:hypothetical protein SXHG_00078 [Synechococcus phage MRHenn-2013a]